MAAERFERNTFKRFIGEQFASHLREQYLPAMRGRFDAGGAIECSAKVIAFAKFCSAGVEAHSHIERAQLSPILGGELALGLDGRTKGGARRIEGHAKGIADGFEDVTVVSLDSLAHKRVMASQCFAHSCREFLP